jgi:hypothetical protein
MTPKLTKKEYFAVEAMKAILSNSKLSAGIDLDEDPQVIALTSVILAEELIRALEDSDDIEADKKLKLKN